MTSLRIPLALSVLACACASETPPAFPSRMPPGSDAGGPGGDGDGDGDERGGDEQGDGDSTGGPNDDCSKDIDVVFVIDVSGSMVPALSKLVEEVGRVHEVLVEKDLPSPPRYGLVAFVDDVAVQNGGQPYADIDALIAAVNAEVTATTLTPWRQLTNPFELNLSWPENSLDALHAAAGQFAWRDAETTHRTIIHITDASFWELEKVSSAAGDPLKLEPPGGCSIQEAGIGGVCTMVSSQHTYDETIEALRAAKIWTNTFAAKTGGPPTAMPAPTSHGIFRGIEVNVGIGFHEDYDGKPSIAESSGGLAWDVDEVYDGTLSLATPITEAIERTQCMSYPIY